MNKRKLLRRLNFLMYNTPLWFTLFKHFEDVEKINSPFKPKYVEIVTIAEELELTFDEITSRWREIYKEKFENKKIYRKRPTVIRKDNKDIRVGSGGSNKNKIRRPRKCRKTAWKRFYKLFPHLKPNE